MIKSYLQEAEQEYSLTTSVAVDLGSLFKSPHTARITFDVKHNPPYFNKDTHDETIKSLVLASQVRTISLEASMGRLDKLDWTGCILDIEYQMDHFDGTQKYTTVDEVRSFLSKLKASNKDKYYSVAIFMGARQVEEMRLMCLELFTKVERRYWYKVNDTYLLPRPTSVSSQIEHFLLCFAKPLEAEGYESWQFNYENSEERTNVYSYRVVKQGWHYDQKVRSMRLSRMHVIS